MQYIYSVIICVLQLGSSTRTAAPLQSSMDTPVNLPLCHNDIQGITDSAASAGVSSRVQADSLLFPHLGCQNKLPEAPAQAAFLLNCPLFYHLMMKAEEQSVTSRQPTGTLLKCSITTQINGKHMPSTTDKPLSRNIATVKCHHRETALALSSPRPA